MSNLGFAYIAEGLDASVSHDPPADPRPQRYVKDRAVSASGSEVSFGKGRQLAVVLDEDGQPKLAFESLDNAQILPAVFVQAKVGIAGRAANNAAKAKAKPHETTPPAERASPPVREQPL